MRDDDCRDVPLTLAVALTLWAAGVAAGTDAGVFLRLPPQANAALAAFLAAFASGVVLADARVRGWLSARGAAVAWAAALGAAVLLVAAGAALSASRQVNLAAAPWAPLAFFVLPVTAAAAIAAVRAALAGRRSGAGCAVQAAGD